MNMLIIGNGFDLAHERPTKYTDFFRFLDAIQRTRNAFEVDPFVQWINVLRFFTEASSNKPIKLQI